MVKKIICENCQGNMKKAWVMHGSWTGEKGGELIAIGWFCESCKTFKVLEGD